MTQRIVLEPLDMHWIDGAPVNPEDQCVHGRARLEVDGVAFITPEDDDFTLSAAALHLLRTLEHDHTSDAGVTDNNQLFPHCGHFLVAQPEGRFPVIILGCGLGVDLELVHAGADITLRREGRTATIPRDQWHDAVVEFTERVRRAYAPPKKEPDDELERDGWRAFWKEWDDRRNGGAR